MILPFTLNKDNSMSKETHEFLAEELLQPMVNKCDGGRNYMHASHIVQAVTLTSPTRPKVFTNFENQVGEITSGISRAKRAFKPLKVIKRTAGFYTLIVKYDDGTIDVLHNTPVVHLTESYGYARSFLAPEDWKEVEEVQKGQAYSEATCYDEYSNLMMGTNLKTVFYPKEGMTYEDSVVISKTAAEKLSYTKVTVLDIPVNTNDILLNLYGDDIEYKAFPDVGENIKDGIICSRRRIVNATMLGTLNSTALKNKLSTDSVIYGQGKIEDIYIYSNRHSSEFTDPSLLQIRNYLIRQEEYDRELTTYLDTLVNEGYRLCSDASYYYRRSLDSLDENIEWKAENAFDNLVIKFTVSYNKPAVIGSKITTRYGGKGVVSAILPEDQMPKTKDGLYAEVCLNPLGVINRLNLSTLFELELNFIADEYSKRFKECPHTEKLEALKEFYLGVNQEQRSSIVEFYDSCSEEDKVTFVAEFFEEGFPIHEPPFWNNVDFDWLMDLYEGWDIAPVEFEGIENRMVIGDLYFMRLKHEPSSKLSVRSCGQVNMKGVPNKSNRVFKAGMAPFSNTPIRFGEQELLNILLCNNPKAVFDMLDFHSSNEEDRLALIEHVLTKKELPFNIPKSNIHTIKELIKAHMTVLGIKLEE